MHFDLRKILLKIIVGVPVSARQLINISELLPQYLLDLMLLARAQTSCYAGSAFTCGIINAKSGNCTENCSFCAQSQYHTASSPVYSRVSLDTLQKKADELVSTNAKYMGIVISGKSLSPNDLDFFCNAVERISKNFNIKVCASFGIISQKQAIALRQAGFTSYHHNLESSRSFFPYICTTHTYKARIATIKNAKAAGLRVCSGGIFGMGETWEQRIELMRTLRRLQVDSIPINFLTAIKGTPLEEYPAMPPQQALAIIALTRLVHPEADIIVAGGRKIILGDWEKLIFSAGANGLMVGSYLTTTGGSLKQDMEMMQVLGVY